MGNTPENSVPSIRDLWEVLSRFPVDQELPPSVRITGPDKVMSTILVRNSNTRGSDLPWTPPTLRLRQWVSCLARILSGMSREFSRRWIETMHEGGKQSVQAALARYGKSVPGFAR
jgi:hypothetical protein